MIENGGCLPPLLSSVSLPAGKKVTKKPSVFPIMETARRCCPGGLDCLILRFAYHSLFGVPCIVAFHVYMQRIGNRNL
ncbi:MAG: hypothetical protein ACLUSK_02655 [Bacteroides stercoris]